MMDARRLAGLTGNAVCSRGCASFLALCFAMAVSGCSSEEPIVVDRVPKDAVVPASVAAATTAADDRMLAAIVPWKGTAWFFKLVGPDKAAGAQQATFLGFVKSLRFEGDRPVWTLPEGWAEQAGSGMRFATLSVPGVPAGLSVTSLSVPAGDTKAFLLSNVNRWRGQMGLSPIAAEKLHAGGGPDDETTQLALGDGGEATLVNFKGAFEDGGMSAPFAGGGPAATTPLSPTEIPGGTESEPPLAYEVPEGWKDLGTEGISVATFAAGDSGRAARVTVIPLSASNELLANVNRWRDQVGLKPIEPSQLDGTVETVVLGDGGEGKYVSLVAPEGADPKRAILAVMALRGDTAWFVKLDGHAETAVREKANFETFVKSLRLAAEGD